MKNKKKNFIQVKKIVKKQAYTCHKQLLFSSCFPKSLTASTFFQSAFCDPTLSHNNLCFQCNIAITNFLVSNMCEIRFHDIIDRTIRMFTSRCHPTQNVAKRVCFGPLFSFISFAGFSYVIKRI